MTDTLDNGIKLPAKGSRDWYSDASSNAHLIDEHLGDEDVHLTDDDRTAISSISSKANSSDVYTKTEIDTSLSSKANTSDLTTHTSNSDIHVTSTDKTTWNAKQSALSTAQLNACNSGITSTKVSSYDTHVANSDVHVTTSDKSTWNAKQNALSTTQISACNSGITSDKVSQYDGYATSKANDSDVVHTTGNETINGAKTFSNVKVTNIARGVNTSSISINGGSDNSTGASIYMYGTEYGNDSKGSFIIRARGTSNYDLTANNSGVLSWRGSSFIPYNSNTDLGTTSSKWKTINGINPGALSLPNLSDTSINIDTTNWDLTGVANSYTPTKDGYIVIRVENSNNLPIISWYYSSYNSYSDARFANYSPGSVSSGFIPVRANTPIYLVLKATSIKGAKFYPCQGNV